MAHKSGIETNVPISGGHMTLMLNPICYKQVNKSHKNVTNEEELRDTLSTAVTNREDDTINIAAGRYNTDGTTFTYTPPAAAEENFSFVGAGAG